MKLWAGASGYAFKEWKGAFYPDDLPDKEIEGLESFPADLVAGTNAFFGALQRQSGWFDLAGTTKTAAAYDAFCRTEIGRAAGSSRSGHASNS